MYVDIVNVSASHIVSIVMPNPWPYGHQSTSINTVCIGLINDFTTNCLSVTLSFGSRAWLLSKPQITPPYPVALFSTSSM